MPIKRSLIEDFERLGLNENQVDSILNSDSEPSVFSDKKEIEEMKLTTVKLRPKAERRKAALYQRKRRRSGGASRDKKQAKRHAASAAGKRTAMAQERFAKRRKGRAGKMQRISASYDKSGFGGTLSEALEGVLRERKNNDAKEVFDICVGICEGITQAFLNEHLVDEANVIMDFMDNIDTMDESAIKDLIKGTVKVWESYEKMDRNVAKKLEQFIEEAEAELGIEFPS